MMSAHRARKRFGQHFLHDQRIVQRIVRGISPLPGDHLVEIGPGLGALTKPLLEACGRLDVVELDRDVIPMLEENCTGAGELVVHQADALRFDFTHLAGARTLRVVGNLPYNISTPLLFHLLEQADAVQDMHFMLQKEVVDRMGATAGEDAYGRLSVMLAWRCSVEPLFDIGPGAFKPPPRVHSTFVRLVPWLEAPFDVGDPFMFGRLVTQAFSMRRKTLRNGLKGLLDEAAIVACGVDPAVRPETIAPAGFAALSRAAAGLEV